MPDASAVMEKTMSAMTKTAPQSREDRASEIRPVYLEALTLVERLHRRLLDVVKD